MHLPAVGKGKIIVAKHSKIMKNIPLPGGKAWKKYRENVIFVWVLFVFGKGEGVGVVGH